MTWVDTRQAHPDPIQQIRFGVTGKPPRRTRRSKPWLDDYRAAALAKHGHLTLIDRHGTFTLPLSEAYVPLSMQRVLTLRGGLGASAPERRVEEVFAPAVVEAKGRGATCELEEDASSLPESPPEPQTVIEGRSAAASPRASRALIDGDAGTGKSTALKKLLATLFQTPDQVPGVPAGAVPLFLRLADHVRTRDIEALAKETVVGLPGLKDRHDLAEVVWRHRPLVLLLDGLDELGNDDDRRLFLEELTSRFGPSEDVWVAISCRPSGRGQTIALPPEYRAFKVLPLLDGDDARKGPRAEFVRRWFRALARKLEDERESFPQREAEEKKGSDAAPDRKLEDERASLPQSEAEKVLDALFSERLMHGDALALLSTPLFLSLFCTVSVEKDELPGNEVALFEAALRVLLERPTLKEPDKPPPWSASDARAVLQPVSYHLQLEDRTQTEMDERLWLQILDAPLSELSGFGLGRALATVWGRQRERLARHGLAPDDAGWEKILAALLAETRGVLAQHGLKLADDGWAKLLADPQLTDAPRHSAPEFLTWLHHQAGLLEKHGLDHYRFRHRAFPEFLAAAHVVAHGLGHVLARSFVAPAWRETILYAIHLGQAEMFDALVDALLERKAWYREEVARERLGEVLRQLHAPYSGHFATHLCEAPPEEQQVILQLFAGRADAALLDAAEDGTEAARGPRPPAGAAHQGHRPRLAGRVGPGPGQRRSRRTGAPHRAEGPGRRADDGLEGVERHPAHPRGGAVRLLAGARPVTNRQYERFLRAKPETREPSFWRDRKYNDPSQPVVGVRWEEARAFCRWLQDQLRNAARVELPTEAQWERAARGKGDRIFPWGDDKKPKTEVAYGRSSSDGPARVGMHPADTGPFGHRDLAGNVWDWCLDVYVKDAYARRAKGPRVKDPPAAQGTGANNEAHVMRGGAGWHDVGLHGTACRGGRHGGDGLVDGGVGFRVCVSPPSTV